MKKFINGKMMNLAEPRLGSKVIFKTDDFFASANRIINSNSPIFKEGIFDKHGKWMDGWETKRRRRKGFDYLIIKLGKPGKIFNVDIDTTYFSGNQPMQASLEACHSSKNPNNKSKWITILNKKKFGFPFIIAVKGKNKEEILNSFRQRITNNINLEFEEAKKQVKKIANFRLSEIIK